MSVYTSGGTREMAGTRINEFYQFARLFFCFCFSPEYFTFYLEAALNPPQRSMMPKANTAARDRLILSPRSNLLSFIFPSLSVNGCSIISVDV